MAINIKTRLDPNKPTILICSDSAAIHTGLARVTRTVFKRIHAMNKYNIVQQGWFHMDPSEQVPWPIYSTEHHPQNKNAFLDRDRHGANSINRVLSEVKPQIVFGFHDPWTLSHLAKVANKDFKFVAYTCVDSEPMTIMSKDTFEGADKLIVFGEWAKNIVLSDNRFLVNPENVEIIPHGVDTNVFAPLAESERVRLREALGGFTPEDFIFGCIARNQARKNLGRLVQFTNYLKFGSFFRCESCEKITPLPLSPFTGMPRGSVNRCEHCNSTKIIKADPNPHVHIYYHGSASESIGWDFPTLVKQFNIADRFHFSTEMKPHAGVSDIELNQLMNCFDCYTMPTVCEGFGLPILESMGAGVPVLLPNYSAYMEWAQHAGLFVKSEMFIEAGLNSVRAQILMHDWLKKADTMIRYPEVRKLYGVSARKSALNLDWVTIVDKFDRVFTNVLKTPNVSKFNLTRI